MNAKTLRAGVVGVGRLGEVHARIYGAASGVSLAGVYDVDPGRSDQIARDLNTKAFESLDDLIEGVDLASVVVPTPRHFDVASRLLERGVHTLIEKPITETPEQADRLLDLARSRGVLVQVGHVERFNPVMRYLEEVLDGPRFIEAHRLASFQTRGTDVGVVLDLMIHDLDVILHLVGRDPLDVRAVGLPVLSPFEDIANARIEFEGGCVANVTASRVSPERLRKIRVFQRNAYVSLDYMAQTGLIYRKKGGEILKEDVPIEKAEPLRLEIEDFVRSVGEGIQPKVTIEQARAAVALACRIREEIGKSMD